MFVIRLQMTASERVSVCFCLLTLSGATFGLKQGPGDVKVVVKEGSDAMLPCSSTKMNKMVFDWKTDDSKEVFFYDAGKHYNNGRRGGQNEQFKGRVSYFEEEVTYGNASIMIRNTKVTDSANYTCIFPHSRPLLKFHIELVVELILKDRSREISGAAPKLSLTIVTVTNSGVQLQCDVPGASPKPKVEWQDSDGNSLHAEDPQFTERGGSYNVTLSTTVTKAGCFHCVVKQEEISHMIEAEISVSEKLFEGTYGKVNVTGWLVGGMVLGAFILALARAAYGAAQRMRKHCGKGSGQQRDENPSEVALNPQPV